MAELRGREGVSARTLEFIILTCVRSGEARGTRWPELDGEIWSIPAERMKRGRPHRVPLSPEALSVLGQVRTLDPIYAFPSPQKTGFTKPQSDAAIRALLKRMGRSDITVHGFRSTFRDWASENAYAAREVAETVLSHAVGTEVEQAYARSDMFERRRELMLEWGDFLAGK